MAAEGLVGVVGQLGSCAQEGGEGRDVELKQRRVFSITYGGSSLVERRLGRVRLA